MKRRVSHFLLLFLSAQAFAQNPDPRPGGYTPAEAAARMTLPPGFRVDVFASEPDVRQPVAACFDERGRLWVIEYLQYPTPAGLNPVDVDVYLRTKYDKVPDPPPHGPRGVDRIKILEDTDQDGKADKVTTFVEGLNLASAIAVGNGGVYVGQAPYLLFYPDANRDDVPDGDPEVVLKGFGLEDAHATLNSLTWGPDGWLYGAQGSTVTAEVRGIGFQQGIWRYHPPTDRFELFAEGGGNTWGVDFDARGHLFGSSNGSYIAFHMVQGGYYVKGFAKHGPLHNPRTYGYFNSIAYDGGKQGGHVTPGGIIYQGGQFPPEFNGAFIGGNLLSNTVYWHALKRDGSTVRGQHGGTLIDARDAWFRPIDLLTGPEGSVYVVDWYDRRASHLDPRDNWDRSNGRIYRISFGDPPKVPTFDLAGRSTEQLVNLRSDKNDWWPRTARRILGDRRDASAIPGLLALVQADRDPVTALRDLWALDASGGLDDATALGLLSHPLSDVRRWVIRRLGDDHRMSGPIRERLIELASIETDAELRSQLASSCQRWEPDIAFAILAPLILRPEDAADPHVPLLVWWAIERQMHADLDGAIALLTTTEAQAAPLVVSTLLDRMARALVEGGSEAEYAALARLLTASTDPKAEARVVEGMDRGLLGRRLNSIPESLIAPLGRLLDRQALDPTVIRLIARLGDSQAMNRAIDFARGVGTDDPNRVAFIGLLGSLQTPESLYALIEIIGTSAPENVLAATADALGAFAEPDAADALLDAYPRFSPGLRARAIDRLIARQSSAEQLVARLDKAGPLKPTDLKPAQVVRIAALNDGELTARLEAAWGRIPQPSPAEKVRRIAEVRGMLVEGNKGDAKGGAAVFKETCAACHKLFDQGEAIGPELTGADRSLDFLLESLVNPSAVIRKEYQSTTLALADGRVLSGLVVDDSGATLTLFDSQKQKTIIPKDQIDERRDSEVSVMPDGILDPLREEQIRDLFKYLQSSGAP